MSIHYTYPSTFIGNDRKGFNDERHSDLFLHSLICKYGNIYAYTQQKHLYAFKSHYWINMEEEHFREELHVIVRNMVLRSDEHYNDISKKIKDILTGFIRYLKLNKDITQKMNINPYLIVFKNGVYDLKEKKFRKGLPDDYMTLYIEEDYVEYDKEDPLYYEFTMHMLSSNWQYIANSLIDVLNDHTHKSRLIYVLSKKVCSEGLIEIIRKLLGDFCLILNPKTIYDTNIIYRRCTHMVILEDMDTYKLNVKERNNSNLNPNIAKILKDVSNNDTINYVNTDIKKWDPLHAVFIISDKFPYISYDDTSLWSRLRMFHDDLESNYSEDFHKILRWWLLNNHQYGKQNLQQPKEHNDMMKKLRLTNNSLYTYIDETYTCGENNLGIPLETFYYDYGLWCNENKIKKYMKKQVLSFLEDNMNFFCLDTKIKVSKQNNKILIYGLIFNKNREEMNTT